MRKTVWTLAVLLVSSPAWAQEGERRTVASSIAKVEAKANKLDANKDGWLSEQETQKGRDSLGMFYDAVVKRVDSNKDGRISVEEYVNEQSDALIAADTNGDGWLTADEASAQKRKLIGELLTGKSG